MKKIECGYKENGKCNTCAECMSCPENTVKTSNDEKENEAIKFLRGKYPSWGCDEDEYENAQMAIQALEEIQEFRKQGITIEKALDMMCDLAGAENLIEQYRAIGTVEQLNTLQQDYWKLNEMCKEYSAIGTIEEFKALKEKNTPKKPFGGMYNWTCPTCGTYHSTHGKCCSECMQMILWD